MTTTSETAANLSYRNAFIAVELFAASRNIDMRHLNHRYHSATASHLLRREAANHLRTARSIDKATAAKVWQRHRPQAAMR